MASGVNPGAIVLKEKPNREARVAASAARVAISQVEDDDGGGTGGRRSAAQLAMYDNMIVEGIAQLDEPGGANTQSICRLIEETNSVPSNFKRILASRLKALVEFGTLVKVKQNYSLAEEASLSSGFRFGKRTRLQLEGPPPVPQYSHSPSHSRERDSARPLGGGGGGSSRNRHDSASTKRVKIETDIVKQKKKNAEEAARFAALAVAEAEALAAEAERAAREADEAEAEAEDREAEANAAAEVAVAAFRPPKKRGGPTAGSTSSNSKMK